MKGKKRDGTRSEENAKIKCRGREIEEIFFYFTLLIFTFCTFQLSNHFHFPPLSFSLHFTSPLIAFQRHQSVTLLHYHFRHSHAYYCFFHQPCHCPVTAARYESLPVALILSFPILSNMIFCYFFIYFPLFPFPCMSFSFIFI